MIRTALWDQANPRKTAVIEAGQQRRISYEALIGRANVLGEILRGKPGKNLGIFLPNGGDFIAALFGIFMLGKTACPMNCRMTRYELVPILKQAQVTVVISSRIFSPLFEEIQSEELSDLQLVFLEEWDLPGDGHFAKEGPPFDSLTAGSLPAFLKEKELFDSLKEKKKIKEKEKTKVNAKKSSTPLLLLNTSGSVAAPAIVALSERNIETAVLGYLDKMSFAAQGSKEARYLLASPFSSAYGLMILFACLIKSFPVIVMEEPFTLSGFYRAAERYQGTHYEGSASVLLMMAQTAHRPIPYEISGFRYFGFGGSKISEKVLKAVSEAFPWIRFWQGYGMTEAAPLITKNTGRHGEKPGSVGTAIRGVEIAIDGTEGPTTQAFVQGEILVKGPNVMRGYYRNEEQTKSVLREGWLYTGDIGYLDEARCLYLCGRKKSLVIVGGMNVYPEEVETCLMDSGLLRDCRVYGERDGQGEERLCAELVPLDARTGKKEILAYCRRHLSDYKQPRSIRMVPEIQKTTGGKTLRRGAVPHRAVGEGEAEDGTGPC